MAAGQEKGDERIGNTVEPFDEPGGQNRQRRGHGIIVDWS
jgi:hypothetical protein